VRVLVRPLKGVARECWNDSGLLETSSWPTWEDVQSERKSIMSGYCDVSSDFVRDPTRGPAVRQATGKFGNEIVTASDHR
jgi:hypothetical protein